MTMNVNPIIILKRKYFTFLIYPWDSQDSRH